MALNFVKIEEIKWLPEDIENISSSKSHYALLLYIINQLSDKSDVDKFKLKMKETVKILQKVAEENFEEKDYLFGEIIELTGISIDEETSDFFFTAE